MSAAVSELSRKSGRGDRICHSPPARGGAEIFIGERLKVLVAPLLHRGAVLGEKAPFRGRRALLLARRCTYNFFYAKISPRAEILGERR